MITLQGKFKDGSVRLEKDPGLSENDQVYVLVLNRDRESGIALHRNKLITKAKKTARKRLRSSQS